MGLADQEGIHVGVAQMVASVISPTFSEIPFQVEPCEAVYRPV